MDAKTQEILDNLIEGRKVLKKKMIWEMDSNAMAIMGALLCLSKNSEPDEQKYAECKKILKKHTNILSEFRGVAEAMVISKMTVVNNPEEYVEGCLAVYKKLRSIHKLTASPYMVMAAMTIYENGGVERADENIEKLESLYKKVQKAHPWMTGDSDRPFFALLITAGLPEDSILEEMEACYVANKKLSVLNHDGIHSMAQLMCLSSKSVEEKTEYVTAYKMGMKQRKKPINIEFGLPALGALTLLDMDVEEAIEKTCEIDDFLKKQKGFKWYTVSPAIRRMYSQMVLVLRYLPKDNAMIESIVAGTMTMVIMEEIMMMIIISNSVATTARASSASSGN